MKPRAIQLYDRAGSSLREPSYRTECDLDCEATRREQSLAALRLPPFFGCILMASLLPISTHTYKPTDGSRLPQSTQHRDLSSHWTKIPDKRGGDTQHCQEVPVLVLVQLPTPRILTPGPPSCLEVEVPQSSKASEATTSLRPPASHRRLLPRNGLVERLRSCYAPHPSLPRTFLLSKQTTG